MQRPAILGGSPAFPEGLQFARPFVPPLDQVVARLEPSYQRGMLTNADLVREFEEAAAERLGVAHAVAVSSCTAGLMLVLRALEVQLPVVLPSFTFSASAHAVAWNGAIPRFVECDPDTFQVDPVAASSQMDGAGAILATHVFGAPCPVEAVQALAAETGVPAVFDAAHAFGALRAGQPVGGFGAAEVFSLSPTKLVVGGEGGVVATNRDDVAASVRIGRDYGNPGDYNTRFVGLNARMSEFHAAVALESLVLLDEHLVRRQDIAAAYRKAISGVAGVRAQEIDNSDVSTYKDFTVFVDESQFGLDRDSVVRALAADGIATRCYFSPPVHRQQAYAGISGPPLPITDVAASGVISLPMFADLGTETAERVAEVLVALHEHAEEVRAASAG